jgi:hypothetical protein
LESQVVQLLQLSGSQDIPTTGRAQATIQFRLIGHVEPIQSGEIDGL